MFTIIGGDGQHYGPVSVEQLQAWIAENRVTRETQARREGSDQWAPLGAYPEFGFVGSAGPAPTAATAAGQMPATPQSEPLVFTGDWREYFRIWIVNVLLTLLTLGIYAAWAKVRKRRYFSANTRLMGHAFEYLANPRKILVGNLIVVGVFIVYAAAGAISPLLQLPLMLVFLIAFPWFIVRALAFNARNTAWRGIRFNFNGTYGESAAVFLGWPILVPFTFGLLFPFVAKKQKEFLFNRSAYGTAPFRLAVTNGDFYRLYGIAALFFLPLIVGYIGIIASIAVNAAQGGGGGMPNMSAAGPFGIVILLGFPLAIAGACYFGSRMFNLLWNSTSIEGNEFIASMRARDLFRLHFFNAVVTLFTLGLMHPWAAVRSAKFHLDSLEVVPTTNINQFLASAQVPGSAIGEAASDFFDFEIGFGV